MDAPFEDIWVSLSDNLFGAEAAILGESSGLDLGVSLTDDVFTIANQEASLAVFPVTCHDSVVYSDCSKSPRLTVANVVFPEVNENTYRWRGDQGLLDRLSYPTLERIPENWSQTLIDTKVIEMSRLASEPDLQSSEKRLIGEAGRDWSQDVPLDNPAPHSQPLPSADSETPQKKRRYMRLFKPKQLIGSTRLNKKQPKGNNPYGRTGVKKCFNCRFWRQKVQFGLLISKLICVVL